MNEFYNEIDKALQSYESHKPYHTHRMEWITDRIVWCWQWRKITKAQCDELCERAIAIMDGGI